MLLDSRESFAEIEVQCILAQIVEILTFLKRKLVVHRDFSLSNLMLTEEMTIKLCNFGKAVKLANKDDKIHDVSNADLNIFPPEMRSQEGYSFEVDCFAVGIIVHQLLLKEKPFDQSIMSARSVRSARN